MMFRFMLTDDKEPLRCRRHCQKAFMEGHPNTIVINDDFLYFIIDTILRKEYEHGKHTDSGSNTLSGAAGFMGADWRQMLLLLRKR